MSTVSPGEPSRFAALDGLRTVAVLAVFGYHALPMYVVGGQLGVDVFFVLSGFVITRLLLLEQLATGSIDLRRFYWRRWLRLVPALVAMWVVVQAATLAVPEFRSATQTNIWGLVSLMNIYRAVTGEGGDALGHTWSLGVEEQFYIVWPIVLVLLLGLRWSSRRLLLVIGLLAAASGAIGFALNATPGHWFRIYNAPDTRAIQLLAGCLGAVLLTAPDLRRACLTATRWAGWLVWPAAMVLCVAAFSYHDEVERGSEWQIIVPALLSAIVILALTDHRHPLTRLLAFRPVAWAGARYSYAFYLWHYPIMFLGHGFLPPGPLRRTAVYFVVTAVAAGLSDVLIERTFSRRRGHTVPAQPATSVSTSS